MNESQLPISRIANLRWRLRMECSKLLKRYAGISVGKDYEKLLAVQKMQEEEGDSPRLSESELTRMIEFQILAEDIEYRRNYFRTTPVEKTLPGQLIPLIDELIARDPAVTSVMNIGVRYAAVDHALACKHSSVQFYGVDFMPNVAEMNQEFARENLKFISGYALDLLFDKKITADVTMFSATAIAIRNKELREYLRLLRKTSRYVVLNELIYPLPGGRFVNPDDVDVNRSVATFLQPVPWEGHRGPLCKTHNFRAMLEEAGFEPIHYLICRPEWTSEYVVQLVGRRVGDLA